MFFLAKHSPICFLESARICDIENVTLYIQLYMVYRRKRRTHALLAFIFRFYR